MSPDAWYWLYKVVQRVLIPLDMLGGWLWRKKLAAERSMRRG